MATTTITNLEWTDSADATERGWWYTVDGVADIVVSGTLDADSDRAQVLAAIARQLRVESVEEIAEAFGADLRVTVVEASETNDACVAWRECGNLDSDDYADALESVDAIVRARGSADLIRAWDRACERGEAPDVDADTNGDRVISLRDAAGE